MLPQLLLHLAGRLPGFRAVFVATALALGTAASSAPLLAQGAPVARRMVLHRHARRGAMRMMLDPAARLLDQQMVLQLNGAQVTRLIALHETTRTQQRALAARMRALMPRPAGRRAMPSAAQRDSLSSLIDALRAVRWRATSDADSVLTPDQRRQAARLAIARRSSTRASRWHGGMDHGGMDRGGMPHHDLNAPHGRRPNRGATPNDSGA